MLDTVWRYRARIIPLALMTAYEGILFRTGADFDCHMLVVVLCLMSLVTWPDGTAGSDGIVGYHPLPAPLDIVFAVAAAVLPAVLIITHVLV